MKRNCLTALAAIAAATGVASIAPVHAQSTGSLQQRVQAMEQQLQVLKKQLEATQRAAEQAKTEASSELNSDIKWHLGGFASADYTATNETGTSNQFGAGQFNPIFLVNYKDLILVEGEMEVKILSDASTKFELEFGNISLNATDWLTLTAGRFLSPIGDFQQHMHPPWINKLPDRPAGFVEDGGIEPLNDVGVMARGAFPIGSTVLDYSVFTSNGPQLSDEGLGMNLEGFGADNNEPKAYGGRIGFRPIPSVTIGGSFEHSKVKGQAGTGGLVTSSNFNLYDFDALYKKGNFELRGEYIHAKLGSLTSALTADDAPDTILSTTWRAWYAQASYRLAGITSNPILSNFEPVIRYGQYHVKGQTDYNTLAENRLSFGLDYWFAPSAVAKIAYEDKNFINKRDEKLFHAQAAFGF